MLMRMFLMCFFFPSFVLQTQYILILERKKCGASRAGDFFFYDLNCGSHTTSGVRREGRGWDASKLTCDATTCKSSRALFHLKDLRSTGCPAFPFFPFLSIDSSFFFLTSPFFFSLTASLPLQRENTHTHTHINRTRQCEHCACSVRVACLNERPACTVVVAVCCIEKQRGRIKKSPVTPHNSVSKLEKKKETKSTVLRRAAPHFLSHLPGCHKGRHPFR